VPVADGGVLGWVHHDDAVTATIAALEHGRSGQAYNIVDDEPTSWRAMVTAMAQALDAPQPLTVPRWVFRLVAPLVASFAVETSMRVSNAKAATELDWRPRYPTYRDGVQSMASLRTSSART
jgi:nucleoside-diphosphate-sugar epimerase